MSISLAWLCVYFLLLLRCLYVASVPSCIALACLQHCPSYFNYLWHQPKRIYLSLALSFSPNICVSLPSGFVLCIISSPLLYSLSLLFPYLLSSVAICVSVFLRLCVCVPVGLPVCLPIPRRFFPCFLLCLSACLHPHSYKRTLNARMATQTHAYPHTHTHTNILTHAN